MAMTDKTGRRYTNCMVQECNRFSSSWVTVCVVGGKASKTQHMLTAGNRDDVERITHRYCPSLCATNEHDDIDSSPWPSL